MGPAVTGANKKVELSGDQMRLIARALADPRRYGILRHLREERGEMPCSAVLECVGIGAPTLSHHMKELETAGLVLPIREGKSVRYVLQKNVIAAYLAQVEAELK